MPKLPKWSSDFWGKNEKYHGFTLTKEYDKKKTDTVSGKQENMRRLSLPEWIVIECGIYQKLSLGTSLCDLS